MLNPELAGRIVKEVSKAVSLPVTVKFRKALMLTISMRRNLLRLWKKWCGGSCRSRKDKSPILYRTGRLGHHS